MNPIILLKEGTEQAQGKRQILSNIGACAVVADSVRTTLGPRGMDKLIAEQGGKTTISNDGATILRLLDIVFPAAKTLVDIAKSQDAEVGDGTTTVVVLAAELLKNAKPFIEDGLHPQILIRAYRKAATMALAKLEELAVHVKQSDTGAMRELLLRCASTTLSSKLVAYHRGFFSEMVVDAVQALDQRTLPLNMIGIKKVTGGSLTDSRLVKGVAFKKCFSYAGFEMQPKTYEKPTIALLNIELELKAERDNAEVRIENVAEYQQVVDAEWEILYDKLRALEKSGAKIVLSKLPIGDVATQWFADRDMFCAGRVTEEDLKRTQEACGGAILTTVSGISDASLGRCDIFREEQVGNERFNFFEGCAAAKAATLLLRGGSDAFLDETERSLHDAIMIVRRAIKHDAIVAGGGAIEMELSRHLREVSRGIAGKEQLLMAAFARAFEIIPQQLCYNAGLDATDLLNKLRQKHATGGPAGLWWGVDVTKETLADNLEGCVWEPALVKRNAITAASEAACLVLSVDQTVKNPKAQQSDGGDARAAMGMGGGMGMPM